MDVLSLTWEKSEAIAIAAKTELRDAYDNDKLLVGLRQKENWEEDVRVFCTDGGRRVCVGRLPDGEYRSFDWCVARL